MMLLAMLLICPEVMEILADVTELLVKYAMKKYIFPRLCLENVAIRIYDSSQSPSMYCGCLTPFVIRTRCKRR